MLMVAVLWVLSLVLLQHRVPLPAAPQARAEMAAGAVPAARVPQSALATAVGSVGGIERADRTPASMQNMCERVAVELPGGVAGASIGLGTAGAPASEAAWARASMGADSVDAVGSGGGERTAALSSIPLAQNVTIAGQVAEGKYAYYQACITLHEHTHNVHFDLLCVPGPAVEGDELGHGVPAVGDADLYISTEEPQPHVDSATWISADKGDDRITLRTDLPEFRERAAADRGRGAQMLYVSVYGRSEGTTHFKISVLVTDVPLPKPRGYMRKRRHQHRLRGKHMHGRMRGKTRHVPKRELTSDKAGGL